MAVIIENMNIPENCFSCRFFQNTDSYCELNCYVPYALDNDGNIIAERERATGCPLKEVNNKSILEDIKVEIEVLKNGIQKKRS